MLKQVDLDSLKLGPIRHQSLSPSQMERIYKLADTLVEVDNSPIEEWVDNFKRDLNPDNELLIWEKIADGYTLYCSNRTLSIETKKEVFHLLLNRSMASEQEILKAGRTEHLTLDEIKKILREF